MGHECKITEPKEKKKIGSIIQREQNTERRDFYELLWHTGAAQSDGACLLAEDINWEARTICFTRKKLKSRGTNLKPTLFRFSAEIEALLKRRPAAGPLFPYLCTVRAGDRATESSSGVTGWGLKYPCRRNCNLQTWPGACASRFATGRNRAVAVFAGSNY